MKKLAALIKLTRPVNIIITFLAVAVGYIISASEVSLFTLITAGFSGAFTAGAGNIVNDIFDLESDKINHPDRPLPSNIISYNGAKGMWFLFTLLSFITGSLTNTYAFLIVLSAHILLIFYSFRFKSTTILGNVIISSLTSAAIIYGGFAAENLDKIAIPSILAFMINYIRELVKDIQDEKGDTAAGITTFPVKYGVLNTKIVISVFVLFLFLLTLYPFAFNYYKIEFFILVMLIVNPLMVYIIRLLWKKTDRDVTGRISVILKFNMAVGLLAIYLGQ